MPEITSYGALTTPALADVVPVVDVSDTSMSPDGTTKKMALSTLPMFMTGVQIKLVYMTTAVSGVGSDGWYYPDETTPTLTGRRASITWEGTSGQIPASGTGDADFKVGDTALVRGSSL